MVESVDIQLDTEDTVDLTLTQDDTEVTEVIDQVTVEVVEQTQGQFDILQVIAPLKTNRMCDLTACFCGPF